MLTKIETIFMTHLLFVKDLSHFVGALGAGKTNLSRNKWRDVL